MKIITNKFRHFWSYIPKTSIFLNFFRQNWNYISKMSKKVNKNIQKT